MSDSDRGSERWEALPVQGSGTKNRPYQERCVDPVEPEHRYPGAVNKVCYKDANGNATEPEAVTFLPAKAEPVTGSCVCAPCKSVSSCSTFLCSVLTCGLYRVCRRLPCMLPRETTGNEAEVYKAVTSAPDKNGFYPDLRIGGVKVDTSVIEDDNEQVSFSPSKVELDSPTYLSGSIHFSDIQDEHRIHEGRDEDVDSLITRKLLEVFSEFEINELAKCTSDSMFLKRSQEISQLISDIVQEHNIREQEAECRLVREIIRISTRKSKKKLPYRPQEPQRDSGNDTWRGSRSNSNFVSDGSKWHQPVSLTNLNIS